MGNNGVADAPTAPPPLRNDHDDDGQGGRFFGRAFPHNTKKTQKTAGTWHRDHVPPAKGHPKIFGFEMVSCFWKCNVGIREFSSIETKSRHTTTRVVYVIRYTKVYPNLEDNTIPT